VAISCAFGSVGFSADLAAPGCTILEWTLHWHEIDAWLGYNVKVEIETADCAERGNGSRSPSNRCVQSSLSSFSSIVSSGSLAIFQNHLRTKG